MEYIVGLVILAIGGLIVWSHTQEVHARQQLVHILATRWNGSVQKGLWSVHPKVEFPSHEYQVTLSSGGTSHRSYFTAITVSLHLTRPLILTLYQGMLNPCRLPAFTLLQRLHASHPEIEKAFRIEGSDATIVHGFLSSAVIDRLLLVLHQYGKWGKGCALALTSQHFEFRIPRRLDTAREHEEFILIVNTFLDHIRSLTMIHEVRFGTGDIQRTESSQILWNPQCTESTVPMLTLQRLRIDADTAFPLDLERFLTYAINALGQEYLHQTVEVIVSGHGENLPPYIRNNLAHFFKQVLYHETI